MLEIETTKMKILVGIIYLSIQHKKTQQETQSEYNDKTIKGEDITLYDIVYSV